MQPMGVFKQMPIMTSSDLEKVRETRVSFGQSMLLARREKSGGKGNQYE